MKTSVSDLPETTKGKAISAAAFKNPGDFFSYLLNNSIWASDLIISGVVLPSLIELDCPPNDNSLTTP